MATMEQLERALANADKAGDTDAAKALAGEIQRLRSEQTPPAAAESTADKLVASFPVRLALGAASPVIGAFQLGANVGDKIAEMTGAEPVVGKWTNEKLAELEEMKRRGGHEGFDWAGLLGSIGSGGIITKGLPVAPNLTDKMLQGAKTGGTLAAVTPVVNAGDDFAEKKALQTGTGVAVGGAVPLVTSTVGKTWEIGRHAFDPMTKKGIGRATERSIREIAGDAGERARLVEAVKAYKAGTPGSPTTPGEAIAARQIAEGGDEVFGSGIQAHQLALTRHADTSDALKTIARRQAAARDAALGKIAKTPDVLARAEREARDVDKFFYGNAYEQHAAEIEKARLAAEKQLLARTGGIGSRRPAKIPLDARLSVIKDNPIIKDAAEEARILAKSEGVDIGDPLKSLKGLHYIKLAIDDQFKSKAPNTALGKYSEKALANTKGKLLAAIEGTVDEPGISPAYSLAKEIHAANQGPIDEMKLLQFLQGKLRAPLAAGEERAAVFEKALDEGTKSIKAATGYGRESDIAAVLSPEKMRVVNAILDDLKTRARYRDVGGKTTVPGATAMMQGQEPQIPNLLWRPSMVANWTMRHMAEGANKEANQLAAKIYANPERFAQVLSDAPPSAQRMILEAIARRAGQVVPATAAARNIGGQ